MANRGSAERNRDPRDQSITLGSPIYRKDSPNANLVLRLPALNPFHHSCVTSTRLRSTAILSTMALDRNKEKSVGSDKKLSIFEYISFTGKFKQFDGALPTRNVSIHDILH